MNHFTLRSIAVIAAFLLHSALVAQTKSADRLSVPLSDPSRPAFLKVGLISGGIKVTGYSGKEIIVEGKNRDEDDEQSDSEKREKVRGLHRIPNTSSGISVEEDDNVVTVGMGMMGGSRTTDLTIQVPANTSMKLSSINDGDINVSHVKGDLEISNTNGSISVTDVSGSAVLDALNGDITVSFAAVNPEKSMSFSSLNGTIDVTFPPSLKATVRMKTDQGEIYSDFDIRMDNSPAKVEDNGRGGRGKYRVTLEKMMTGAVNGGGSEIQFKNFNGDIYIRKGK
ncbi:MAG TPA: hypothetical protein VI215_07215 [Bacteroidota bacterium]|jgi:hypothetical protein